MGKKVAACAIMGEEDKLKRYKGKALPMVMETFERLDPESEKVLNLLAMAAGQAPVLHVVDFSEAFTRWQEGGAPPTRRRKKMKKKKLPRGGLVTLGIAILVWRLRQAVFQAFAEAEVALWRAFMPFSGIFRTPSIWTSSPRREPSMANSCWQSRAQGGGDAGSLTLRCSVTPIRCMLCCGIWINTCHKHSVRTTTTVA